VSERDPFRKLRVPEPTPERELCSCAGAPPLLLRSILGPNPLACARCNLEVRPEVLAPAPELAEALAAWRSFHDCFYLLWLDSAEFEDWARSQLSDPTSPVNTRGLALREQLERVRRTYYWWFRDVGADDYRPLTACPICPTALVACDLVGLVCEPCSLLVGK
jgi:hypothetical protein